LHNYILRDLVHPAASAAVEHAMLDSVQDRAGG
jgi:hypothetical protein